MSALTITGAKLREWGACADGYGWFCERYDEGATVEYGVLLSALYTDERHDWLRWLSERVWRATVERLESVDDLVQAEVDHALAVTKVAPNSASGAYSTATSSGADTIAMVAGLRGQAKAGVSGCIALCWYDGKRTRITVGYVGEDGIEADTLYRVDSAGKLVRA